MVAFRPSLEIVQHAGVPLLTDAAARARGVAIAFSSRGGGVSRAPYESLNLGKLTDDDPAAVDENRRRFAAAAGLDLGSLSWCRQIHSARVVEVQRDASGPMGDADALVLRSPGAALVLTADCVPVLLAGEDGVAAVHAGWRGLSAGVIEEAAARLRSVWGAWVGPCVRACCYEVGAEVVAAFRASSLPVEGADRVDPASAAGAALARAGVTNAAVSGVCTACDPGYFSYRRDSVTGRQGAAIALAGAQGA